MTQTNNGYLTPKEAAAILNISPSSIYSYVSSGILTARRTSPTPRARIKICRKSVEEFKEKYRF